MQGGIALKVRCSENQALEALRQAARAEGIAVEEASPHRRERDPRSSDELPVLLGLGDHRLDTLLLEESRAETAVLSGIADAIAPRLRCPISLVVHTDDGADSLRGWNGGEAMSSGTGRASFRESAHRYLELVPPNHVPLGGDDATALLELLDTSLSSELRRLGARYVAVAKREVVGPIGGALPPWKLTLSAPGEAPVYVFAMTTSVDDVARATASRLDEIAHPQRGGEVASAYRDRMSVPASFVEALARRVPDVALHSVERRGFQFVTFFARARIDGEDATLVFWVSDPHSDEPDARTVSKLETAIIEERARISAKRSVDLDSVVLERLRRGEVEDAAATYRARHASYFRGMDEERARAESLAKVEELRRLYRLP